MLEQESIVFMGGRIVPTGRAHAKGVRLHIRWDKPGREGQPLVEVELSQMTNQDTEGRT